MKLGPCSRCGEELSNRPHWTNLKLHQDCYELNAEEAKRIAQALGTAATPAKSVDMWDREADKA